MATDAIGNIYVTGWSAREDAVYDEDSVTSSLFDYCTIKYSPDGTELWVRTYNGPGGFYDGEGGTDQANAIAVDRFGNVYVTGSSEGDVSYNGCATVKYDTNGNQLWVRRYDNAGGGRSVAVDVNGNVSVATDQYTTVKYDAYGVELWSQQYSASGDTDHEASAIAVDAAGNVYVTGWSGSYENYDYATIKYDTNGNQLWVQRYNGPGNRDDCANAIAVDASGDVYVTGTSDGGPSIDDIATIKYDTNGNQLWMERFNGPDNWWDHGYAIAVDASGNVYVAGQSDATYVTIKYDRNGNELWDQLYAEAGDFDDFASAIVVDALGGVYVTGAIGDVFARDYATVKYDKNGNGLWVHRYAGPVNRKGESDDCPAAVAVNCFGNVFVTGSSDDELTSTDFATVAYDPQGNQLWVRRYNGPGNAYDEATAVAVDATGNVYVTGTSWGGDWVTMSDYATVKYDANGSQVWARRYDGPGHWHDFATGVAVDASGNVCVTGYSPRGQDFYWDYTTVKYDANGNQLWVRRYNGPGDQRDYAWAIAADAAGNIYVTGESYGGEASSYDCATVKYDANGNQLWVQRYNSPQGWDDGGYAVALDTACNVYVTGYAGGYYLTIKYDTNGNQLWTRLYGGQGTQADWASAIAVDASGNVYVAGASDGGATDYDYATIKYDTDGDELWIQRYNGPIGILYDIAQALAIDASGNVYVTGYSFGEEDDFATVKYDTNGNQLWAQRYAGPGNSLDGATSLVVDKAGNVYVGGSAYDGVDGGWGDGSATLVAYGSDGRQLWANQVTGTVGCFYGVRLDPSGRVIATGVSYGDFFTATYSVNQPIIKGKVTFGSLKQGVKPPSSVHIDIRANGQVVGSPLVSLAADGSYSMTVAPGLYDFSVKQDHWLRRTVRVDASGGSVSGVDFALVNGDASGDNSVGVSDLGVVLLNFNTADPMADLDGSGIVGVGDLSVVLLNFKTHGDQ